MLKIGDTRINDEWIEANEKVVKNQQTLMDRSRYAHEEHFLRGAAGQLEARKYHDCWDRLPHITCPVHLAGELYDGIAYPQSMRNMQQRLPNSKLHFYEGGHLFMLSDSRVFPDLIEFLQS